MKLLRIVIVPMLLLLAFIPGRPVQAQTVTIPCQRAATLTRATRVGASACFRVTPSRGSTALRIDLAVTGGAYDLYVRQGSATALSDEDKVNLGALSGSLTYIYPGTGAFTVGVMRRGSSGAAQLAPAAYQVTIRCSGSKCVASYPLTAIPGAKFADQAIFAMPGANAGQIAVRATWTGSARLSALLYGPGVTKTGVALSALARKDGASPLALSYSVRSGNMLVGGKWSVGLSNAGKAGGAIPGGTLSITYPQ